MLAADASRDKANGRSSASKPTSKPPTGKLRDELLDRQMFYTLTEAKILIERWRRQYNTVRPHSALGYRPPAPEAVSPAPLSGMIMSPALS